MEFASSYPVAGASGSESKGIKCLKNYTQSLALAWLRCIRLAPCSVGKSEHPSAGNYHRMRDKMAIGHSISGITAYAEENDAN